MSGDNRGCIDRNECLDFPCLNGGTCYNKEPRLRYSCVCPNDFYGDNCEFVREQQHLKLSTSALASVVACLIVIISEYCITETINIQNIYLFSNLNNK